jgi:hypothetical protein
LAAGAGALLAGAARLVAAARTAPKPLHPHGEVWSGVLVRRGGAETGITWLDQPGTDRAIVRQSRALGLPAAWPDVHGLAIRAEQDDGGIVDVLLATTGWGTRSRFVLQAGRDDRSMFFGSLLPYRSRLGPVSLGALRGHERSWNLVWSAGRGPWRPFARLVLEEQMPGQDLSFDPVLNAPPGLAQYDALARLRLPAYRSARRTRGSSVTHQRRGTTAA